MFACVVGAIYNSPYAVACVFFSNCPYYKFTHVTNRPHVEGLIAISPYTCVYWTFTNIHVNTQKSITGMVWVLLRTL